jgi:hypothetical protein
VIVPANPFKLARVIVEVAEELRGMPRLTGFADIEKSGAVPEVLKTAVCTVSGSGFSVPFVIVTHVFETLVGGVQPVWKTRGIPEVVLVML